MKNTLLNALITNCDSLYFYVLFLSEPNGTLGLRRLIFKRPEQRFVSEEEAAAVISGLKANVEKLAAESKTVDVLVSLQANLIEEGLNPELVLERRTNNEKLAEAFFLQLSRRKRLSA